MFWWVHDRILNTRRLYKIQYKKKKSRQHFGDNDQQNRSRRTHTNREGKRACAWRRQFVEQQCVGRRRSASVRRVLSLSFLNFLPANTPACTPRRALTLVWCRRPSGVSIAKAVWACVCVSMRKYRSLSKRCFQVFYCCLFFLSLSLSFLWFHLFWFHSASRTTRCMHSG